MDITEDNVFTGLSVFLQIVCILWCGCKSGNFLSGTVAGR